jgi:hypothetical protein
MKLLTRTEFQKGCLERDGHKCVMCGQPPKDVHHIIERRLFPDGGYYLDNGSSLCADCHFKAEQTVITPEQIREKVGITKPLLPPHLYPDYQYDKWANIVHTNGTRSKGELFYDPQVQKVLGHGGVLNLFNDYIKYPRTFHLPFSVGRTDDDRAMPDCSHFEGQTVVIMNKLDGENTTAYWDGHVHARSLDSGNHPSRNWVKQFLASRLHELPKGWRINGENMFAKHSIHYKGLEGYFYLFAMWNEKNQCLSWRETVEWGQLLDIPICPVWFHGFFSEGHTMEYGEQVDAGMKDQHGNEVEGFVVRNTDSFDYSKFRDNVSKFVRRNHVQTNQHWIRTAIVKNELKKTD